MVHKASSAGELSHEFALVWVFQDGNLAGLLGVGTARIREAYAETGDTDRAVAAGLQRTGRIVTSAAALIVVGLPRVLGRRVPVHQAGRPRHGPGRRP
ncbi:MAG: hypothetical protein ACRD2W_24645 [Acidimicrobiales bacterium]